jgi:hypothetical protein
MRTLVPETAPQDAESWEDIFRDVERVIMPGVSILVIILPYKTICLPEKHEKHIKDWVRK